MDPNDLLRSAGSMPIVRAMRDFFPSSKMRSRDDGYTGTIGYVRGGRHIQDGDA